jgi:hypothetical protein
MLYEVLARQTSSDDFRKVDSAASHRPDSARLTPSSNKWRARSPSMLSVTRTSATADATNKTLKYALIAVPE